MDGVDAAHWLGRVAHRLNQVGLGRLTARGKKLLGRRTLKAEILGFRLRGSLTHREYLAEMRGHKREGFMAELFEEAVSEGDTVVDVGACLGLFTLLAARKSGPDGRVLAVEAHPETYGFLVENIAANGFAERVEAVQRAASDRVGVVRFFLDDTTASSSGMYASSGSAREIAVESSPIDDLVAAPNRLAAVKIDAEGAEVQVLRGMREILRRAPARLRLFAECNPELLERAGESTETLVAELAKAGFVPRLIDEARHELVAFDGDLRDAAYVNLLCDRAATPA
jgi:FkbM family methyltransferase